MHLPVAVLSAAAMLSFLAQPTPPVLADPVDPPAGVDDGPQPGQPAAWDVVGDAPMLASPSPQSDSAAPAAAATDCRGSATRSIRYTSDGVIHLEGCGQVFRLSDVAAAPGMSPDRIQLVDPPNKIWLLKAKLKIEEGATLRVIGGLGGDANWLRLRSDPASAVWLRAENGNLLFQNTKVTSWDTAAGAPDTNTSVAADGSGGRAYVAVRSVLTKNRPTVPPAACSAGGGQEPYEGRMDVVGSEIGYLGYNAAESYGMVWKVYYKVNAADPADQPPPGRQLYALVDVFGSVTGSMFHHNYFGSYTFGGYCMGWANNTFAENIQYGLDPHDDSDFLTIENNIFRDNGNHGVICSVYCDHLVIRNNQSLRNQHGIMLHRNSDGALVEGNVVRGNRGSGIAIFDSHDAIVRNNTVENNGEAAVRLSVGASRNLVEHNTLTGLEASGAGPGYVIYTFKGSDLPTAGDGRPKQNVFRANRIAGYKNPLFKIGDASANLFVANTLAGTARELAFTRANDNTLHNSPIGNSFRVVLDSSSSVKLENTRGATWQLSRAVPTVATPRGSSVDLTYASAGPAIDVTTLDLAVRPQSGTVAVLPSVWQAGTRAWSERASGVTGTVAHEVGGLEPSACYRVANGASRAVFTASGGRISFSGAVSGVTSFTVMRLAQCSAGVTTNSVLVPIAQR